MYVEFIQKKRLNSTYTLSIKKEGALLEVRFGGRALSQEDSLENFMRKIIFLNARISLHGQMSWCLKYIACNNGRDNRRTGKPACGSHIPPLNEAADSSLSKIGLTRNKKVCELFFYGVFREGESGDGEIFL